MTPANAPGPGGPGLPGRLVLSADDHTVYAPDQDDRLVLSRDCGFDGRDLPTIKAMVDGYNSRLAAGRLYSAVASYLMARHLGNPAHVELADRELRNAVQGYEAATPSLAAGAGSGRETP